METYQVMKKPLITEKSTIVREESNKYFFEVDRRANKVEIGKAVEKLFNVKVVDVKTMIVKGKVKRMGRYQGKRPDWKKAIVTLQAGYKIEIFDGM